MATYELVLRREGLPSERFEVSAGGLVVGRNEDCDITLQDQLVSRRHARLWCDDDKLYIEDLGSRNGIEVNGSATRLSELKDGDELQIGPALFIVAKMTDSQLGRTVISEENAASLYQSMVSDTQSARLPILYKAAQLLGSVFDQEDLLRQILGLIFEAVPVRRGFVMLKPHAGTVEPRVRASMTLEKGEGGPPLSRTLIQHVLDSKDSMLTLDAQVDSRFDQSESIMGHNIHTAMCVPLCGRDDAFGVIYVDSGTQAQSYSRDDLELLTAIARVVGIAIENARLYQENVRRERLAAIGEATAGVGHCVKNILTGIRGGGEFIGMALEKGELRYVEKGWPILKRSIQRIDDLVMNMLSFSKERQPERLPCDMNSLIREVIDGLRERAEKSKVEIQFEAGPVQRTEVDQREVYRVLMNLIVNGMDACERTGGLVQVTCHGTGEGCTVCIRDTGVGIPAEILPKLSQAFVSTKGSAGTGLGLACSYKIIQEHGGHISVDSTVGKGTVFTIFLPNVQTVMRPTERIVLGET